MIETEVFKGNDDSISILWLKCFMRTFIHPSKSEASSLMKPWKGEYVHPLFTLVEKGDLAFKIGEGVNRVNKGSYNSLKSILILISRLKIEWGSKIF